MCKGSCMCVESHVTYVPEKRLLVYEKGPPRIWYEHKALKRHCGINAHYDCVTCLFATLVSLSRFIGVLSKLMHFNNIEYSTALQSFTFVSPKSRDFSRLEITLPFACVVPPELIPLTTHWNISHEFLSRCLLLNSNLVGQNATKLREK